eukprot:CAMPEP_0184369490 /NCGR_PEP_ID=MMETSP1089-20130417/162275_1 /TAXON_ID=38269 ORGANISM="Gloeochaete wittrockiana, Strain SAG46.84" /NCGR_SAMPLE_ID=MMETSP1089 /ASSEMBLY_ACC=CAM_ASM_000445 /LENGTH=147 /DNA_ID=CAMNT_0026711943 /DNA_START=186 /DNA_END=629 /DNA_ORIENTATION=+
MPALRNLALFLGKQYDWPRKQVYRLPDMRGRTLFGPTSSWSVGQQIGTPSVRLEQRHLAPHTHSGSTQSAHPMGYYIYDLYEPGDLQWDHDAFSATGYTNGRSYAYNFDSSFPLAHHWHDFTTNPAGNGDPFNIIPPAVVVNFIIKY